MRVSHNKLEQVIFRRFLSLEPVPYLALSVFLSELMFLLGIAYDTRITIAFLLGGADTAERKIR